MCSRARSAKRRGQGGFTLIELMIGVVIGLLASLAVTHVLVNAEGSKRTTTSASDAQVNGALALSTLQRTIQSSGYGFAATPAVIGCTLTASFGGAPIAGFPERLVPVTITPNGTAGLPDTVRVLSSGKHQFSLPLRIVSPGYKKNDTSVPVASVLGVQWTDTAAKTVGDLMVLAVNSTTPCGVFQVTSSPGVTTDIKRGDDAGWNAPATPAETYGSGSFAINMGSEPLDVAYTIVDGSLRATTLRIDTTTFEPSYDAAVELFPNIVNLQAYYGKDTANTGVVNKWDKVAPTTNAEWLQVIAVRLAVVARSAQFEKEDVTHENLLWDVGSSIAMTGSEDCNDGKSKCLRIKIDHLEDYKRYRYRVFDTVIPLRNMLWNS